MQLLGIRNKATNAPPLIKTYLATSEKPVFQPLASALTNTSCNRSSANAHPHALPTEKPLEFILVIIPGFLNAFYGCSFNFMIVLLTVYFFSCFDCIL